MRFAHLGQMNYEIAALVVERVNALGNDALSASTGASNISESAYVELNIGEDDLRSVKLRFSNHDDRHGSDHNWLTTADATLYFSWDVIAGEVRDEDGEVLEYKMLSVTGTADERDEAGIIAGESEFSHVEMSQVAFDRYVAEAMAVVSKEAGL